MLMKGHQGNIVRRQGLLGGVGSIVSGVGSGVNSALSGVGAGVSSGLGDITSAIIPTTSITSSSSSSTSLKTSVTPSSTTHTSSSTLESSLSTFSSTSTSTSISSSSVSSTTSSTSSTPSSSPSVYISTTDGVQQTITAFVSQPSSQSSPSPSQTSSASSSPNGFLSNKPLEGFIFAICGVVGLVIIFVVATFAIRRSRRRKMIDEALSFEPTSTHGYIDDMDQASTGEKRNSHSSAAGSTHSASRNPRSNNAPYMFTGFGQQAQGAYGYERQNPAYIPQSSNVAYDTSRTYGSYNAPLRALESNIMMSAYNPPQPINPLPSQTNLQ